MSDFLMPSLGPDMEAGTLVEWLVKPGDPVKRGDIVAVVETEKGAIDIEIFESGTLAEIVVPVGTLVPVGTVLARIGGDDVTTSAPATAMPSAPPPRIPAPAAATPPLRPDAPPAPVAGRVRATPAARRRAAELGVQLDSVTGTGPGGAVDLADVEARAARPAGDVPSRRTGFDAAAMRKAIGTAMGRSKREIPHYYLGDTVDLGPALAWLETANRDRPPPTRLLPAVLLLKASATALAKTPELNGHFVDGSFRPGAGIHVGWAISLRGGGLVAPAIHDVGHLMLDQLMIALRDLVQRARSGGLRSSELSDPTITVTSIGDRGAEMVLPVIFPPQVAIVGFGRVGLRPLVVNGVVTARPATIVTLAADHRVSDGHRGGLLLAEIARLLQEPEAL